MKKKLTSGRIFVLAAALTVGMGSFTAYRMAQPKAEPLSDLTLANLEAMAISLEDLEKDPNWPPKLPEGENRNAWLPDGFNPGKMYCAGSGNACRAGVN